MRELTKTAAAELGKYGFRVNAVLPGFVDTEILSANSTEMNEQASKNSILGRLGQPEEIAKVVLFLISDDSAFVTGADFIAEGGYTL